MTNPHRKIFQERGLLGFARYKAMQKVREAYRRAGKPIAKVRPSDLRAAAERLLNDPDVIEWATKAVTECRLYATKTKP